MHACSKACPFTAFFPSLLNQSAQILLCFSPCRQQTAELCSSLSGLWERRSRGVMVVAETYKTLPCFIQMTSSSCIETNGRTEIELVTSGETQNVHFHLRFAYVRLRYPNFLPHLLHERLNLSPTYAWSTYSGSK